jgi:hypothetical protein
MTHGEKVGYLLVDLPARGVNSFTTAPPIWRLAWFLGIPLTPPHFMGPRPLAILMGGGFGLLGALLIWYGSNGERAWAAALLAAILAPLFGYRMARYYRGEAERLNLPLWDRYPSG